jgi:hypothetical protein
VADRSTLTSDVELALALGQIQGQLKELVHSVANQSQREEAMGRAIAELKNIPDDIREIKSSLSALSNRMTQIEMKDQREEGGRGVILTILKSPTVAWVITVGAGLWALVSGRLNL